MILDVTIRKTGNSVGLVLPRELLSYLNVGEGDRLFITDMADGAVRISAWDPELARKVKVAETISREYRSVLKELAAR